MQALKAKRTLIIGDIHGNLPALEGALQLAQYNPQRDRLIGLGDYIDGWEQSFGVVEALIKYQEQSPFTNIYIKGNHDQWFCELLEADLARWREESYIIKKYRAWMLNGGYATYQQYLHYSDDFIYRHKCLFYDRLQLYHLEDNKLFLHAGYNHHLGFELTREYYPEEFYWNRSLFKKALQWHWLHQAGLPPKPKKHRMDQFDKIYIGHSPTHKYDLYEPVKMGNVINLDQGCKALGTLTIWIDESDTFVQHL
jgi:serine/threonine protein phosphatase 1